MTPEQKAELELLLERGRGLEMTKEQEAEQRRSFAYGNSAFENPRITRQMVDDAASELGY